MSDKDDVILNSFELSARTITKWIDSFYKLLPNLIVSCFILAIFIILALACRRMIKNHFIKRNQDDLGRLSSNLLFWIVILAGIIIGLTILMPSLKSGDLISGFGIGSIALSFVLKDIFQNWFSGLLILIRLPFRRGDQIKIDAVEGTVQRINPRATVIRTFDGKDVIIPNTSVYSNVVIIQTSQKKRRIEIDITVGYDYNLNFIRNIIIQALAPIEEILDAPEIQVLCWNLGQTSMGLRIRWWISSEQSSEIISRARAIQAIKEAFQANNIDPADPDMVYILDFKQSKSKENSAQINEPSINTVTPPPTLKMCSDDPETYTHKADSKIETLLPEDEP